MRGGPAYKMKRGGAAGARNEQKKDGSARDERRERKTESRSHENMHQQRIPQETKDAILAYCLRLLEQVAMNPESRYSRHSNSQAGSARSLRDHSTTGLAKASSSLGEMAKSIGSVANAIGSSVASGLTGGNGGRNSGIVNRTGTGIVGRNGFLGSADASSLGGLSSSSATSHGHQSVGDFIGGLAVGGYAPGEPGRALAGLERLQHPQWRGRMDDQGSDGRGIGSRNGAGATGTMRRGGDVIDGIGAGYEYGSGIGQIGDRLFRALARSRRTLWHVTDSRTEGRSSFWGRYD